MALCFRMHTISLLKFQIRNLLNISPPPTITRKTEKTWCTLYGVLKTFHRRKEVMVFAKHVFDIVPSLHVPCQSANEFLTDGLASDWLMPHSWQVKTADGIGSGKSPGEMRSQHDSLAVLCQAQGCLQEQLQAHFLNSRFNELPKYLIVILPLDSRRVTRIPLRGSNSFESWSRPTDSHLQRVKRNRG